MTYPIHVLLLDTGKEWGGGTNSMLEWLRRRSPDKFHVTCVFYRNYARGGDALTIEAAVRAAGANFLLLPQRKQPLWAKLAKELLRGVLHFTPKLRAAAIQRIESIWRIRPAAQALTGLLKECKPDILYMNNSPVSNYEGYLAAREIGMPVVQHCRTLPKLDGKIVRLVNETASRVLAVSDSVVDALHQQGVIQDKINLLYNGIDLSQPLPTPVDISKKLGIPCGQAVIVCIAALLPRKGVADVIRGLSLLDFPAHLIILGDGPQRGELEALSVTLGLSARVHFLGFVPEPLPWIAASDLLVLASESEGLGRVLLEAMFVQKPVVASNVSGVRDVVVHKKTGLLFSYGQVDMLAESLTVLLGNPRLLQEYGQAGKQRVRRKFNIENYANGVSAVLSEVAAAHKP